ncbi:MAG TPA: malto-oligosyltrehalose trehalohydrolase [Thermoanaerobaculia bacterium]|nr:malto-oligosyltrehalose trehalohydrolase [Thermoanaerobaculia bacterium]
MSRKTGDTVPPHAAQEAPTAPALERGDYPSAVGHFAQHVPRNEQLHAKPLGAIPRPDGTCEFRVWAPHRDRIEVHIAGPEERWIALAKQSDGYHEGVISECPPGTRYLFRIDGGNERPDPASRLQPSGVHGPSEVIGREFEWHDDGWKGIELEDLVIYELHVGTFTEEGTFDAIIPRLEQLREIGITAIELLPIAQFPGSRNWGYDGVYVGAVQESYGGPEGLKRLVNACHQRGLALFLDVVYNHLGPEGNYIAEFAPYFTDRYKTPWGLALNFDGPFSDYVRWFFIHNALMWVDEFHVDGLRVDAVHAIVDHSAEPFLQDLTNAVRRFAERAGRRIHTIAESDLNDPRVITPADQLGLGFDTQWSDDFHHSLHTILTGERDGYYQPFGRVSDLAFVMRNGYLFVGQHSTYRGRKYGLKPNTTRGARFVVSAQNHDQVGNRMMGERLTSIISPQKVEIAAAAIVLSPFLPMLFMGEEYGETAPFQYFTSHSDAGLIEAVRNGRLEEFDDFDWVGDPPDPHDEETFRRSKLQWGRRDAEPHRRLLDLYRKLFRLRREHPVLRSLDLSEVETFADEERRALLVRRSHEGKQVLLAFNFSDQDQHVTVPGEPAKWNALLETRATVSEGALTLPATSFAVFERG